MVCTMDYYEIHKTVRLVCDHLYYLHTEQLLYSSYLRGGGGVGDLLGGGLLLRDCMVCTIIYLWIIMKYRRLSVVYVITCTIYTLNSCYIPLIGGLLLRDCMVCTMDYYEIHKTVRLVCDHLHYLHTEQLLYSSYLRGGGGGDLLGGVLLLRDCMVCTIIYLWIIMKYTRLSVVYVITCTIYTLNSCYIPLIGGLLLRDCMVCTMDYYEIRKTIRLVCDHLY